MPLGIGIGLSPLVRHGSVLNQDANALGFIPGASASTNVSVWNSLRSGIVNINTPGVYEIDNSLLLKSNTTYNFCEGVTIKKTGNANTYTHTFINEGAFIGREDSNIKFYGNGMRILVNGIDQYIGNTAPRCRAQFQFLKVSRYIVDNFYINDGGTNQYLVSFAGCIDDPNNKSLISNISLSGQKDGLKIIASKGFKIKNLTTSTLDDGLSICAVDYNISMPIAGDCSDFEVDGWNDNVYSGAYGRCLLFLGDSWGVWADGTTYDYQESVNYNGRMYRKQSLNSQVSTSAPTHTTGIVEYPDGVSWMYIMDTDVTSVTVKSGIIKNVSCTGSKYFLGVNVDGYINNKKNLAVFDNITFDNIQFNPTVRSCHFIVNNSKIGTFTVKDSTIKGYVDDANSFNTLLNSKKPQSECSVSELIFNNCNIHHDVKPNFINCNADTSIGKITLLNTNIYHKVNSGNLCLIVGVNQINTIDITGGTITNLNVLVSPISNNTVTVNATDVYFKTPNILSLLSSSTSGGLIRVNATNCQFDNPTDKIFKNDSSTATLEINIISAYGSATADKFTSGNITVIRNNWKVESVNVYNTELIGNSTFDTDTWWDKRAGTTIADGVATITSGGLADYFKLMRLDVLTLGKKYKLSFDAKMVSGTGRFIAANGYTIFFDRLISKASYESFEAVFTAASLQRLNFGGNVSGDVFKLDNVSLKEVII